MKEKLFSVTPNDCSWDYFKGSGKGGQKRNKTENCVRCTHKPSGATATCEETRSKMQNKKKAFIKMTNTEKFKKWIRLEASRKMGTLRDIEQKIKKDLDDPLKTKIEVRDLGKWEEVKRKEKIRLPSEANVHKKRRQKDKSELKNIINEKNKY